MPQIFRKSACEDVILNKPRLPTRRTHHLTNPLPPKAATGWQMGWVAQWFHPRTGPFSRSFHQQSGRGKGRARGTFPPVFLQICRPKWGGRGTVRNPYYNLLPFLFLGSLLPLITQSLAQQSQVSRHTKNECTGSGINVRLSAAQVRTSPCRRRQIKTTHCERRKEKIWKSAGEDLIQIG